jgi:hypothetical protein
MRVYQPMTSVNVPIQEIKYLWDPHFCTCFLCVCWCSFSSLRRVENAIYANLIFLLKDLHTKQFQVCSCCKLKSKQTRIFPVWLYKYAYWKHQPLHLSSIVSRIDVVLFCLLILVLCIQFKISLALIFYPLMTSINMPIRKLKFWWYVSSVLASHVSTEVHILHFGELKMRFLHIVRFVYRKYTLKKFGCLEFSTCVVTWNIHKAHFFPGWSV